MLPSRPVFTAKTYRSDFDEKLRIIQIRYNILFYGILLGI